MFTDVLKIFIPTIVSFILGLLITPLATHFFYKYKMWKKKVRTSSTASLEFQNVHKDKEEREVSVPCVGGIIVALAVILTTLVFSFLSTIFPNEIFTKLNFLSRSQTFIPLGLFFLGSLLGLLDDFLEINGKSHITRHSHWYTKSKIFAVILFGILAGVWFFAKLDMHAIHIPFGGMWELGIFFIPLVILVILGTFSSGVIDGIDGLSGGVFASVFGAYSMIAFMGNQIDLAVFCGVITGAILAFLWFNIPPARFYMGEVGIMPLTVTLAAVAFLSDTVLLLPIIALPLTLTSLSSTIQIISKKYFGRRVFKVAPLHHHFEAIGWPAYKVTMRYWIFSVMFAIIGLILVIISR